MDKKTYYTVVCKAFNPNSSYQKMIRFYDKTKDGGFLPNEWVYEYDTNAGQVSKRNYVLPLTTKFHYNGTLTEEQELIMTKVIKRIRDADYTSGIINMKTGRGKTHIMSEIASRLPGKTLILCHNETNCRSTQDHFVKFYGLKKEDIGQAYSGSKRITDLTVTTHKTFGLHPEYFEDFEILLYDEAHKNISEIMIRALCKMKNCTALYGFSGTPYRDNLNKSDLERLFWKEITVQGYTKPEERYNVLPTLYAEEYISPRYYYIDYNELRNCAMNDEDRTQKQLETLVKYQNKFDRKCSLVFTDRVLEAETYKKFLDKNPAYSVIMSHWGVPVAQTNEELTQARLNGKPMIIIWTIQKLGCGTDIPYIDAVFFFSPTKFNGTVVQAVGRWLRLHESKTDIILVDWHDNDKAILHRQHLERVKICKKEYWAISNPSPFLWTPSI